MHVKYATLDAHEECLRADRAHSLIYAPPISCRSRINYYFIGVMLMLAPRGFTSPLRSRESGTPQGTGLGCAALSRTLRPGECDCRHANRTRSCATRHLGREWRLRSRRTRWLPERRSSSWRRPRSGRRSWPRGSSRAATTGLDEELVGVHVVNRRCVGGQQVHRRPWDQPLGLLGSWGAVCSHFPRRLRSTELGCGRVRL